MAYTTPRTWVAGETVTASHLNTHVRDNLSAIVPNNTVALTTVAHSSGNFTASSGTWTVESGDHTLLAYVQIGKMMCVTFDLQTTSVSATPTELRIAIPNSKTAARTASAGMFAYNQNGTPGTGNAVASSTTLALYRDLAATAWSTATNTTRVQGTVWFEVQ